MVVASHVLQHRSGIYTIDDTESDSKIYLSLRNRVDIFVTTASYLFHLLTIDINSTYFIEANTFFNSLWIAFESLHKCSACHLEALVT